jgi:phage terminase large subunit-like protein
MAQKNLTTADVFQQLAEKVKRTATQPNIYGYKPHDKQQLFHTAPGKDRLYIGGNRAGKTVAGVCEDIFWATGRHPYRRTPATPTRGRVVGVDFLNGIAKIILPEVSKWLPPSDLINGSWEDSYSKSERTLTLANGSFIEFMSYDQELDKFAGTSRHFTHFDEEPPQDIYTECKARLIDTGGSWWMTMTPVEGMTWIHDDIYEPGKRDPTNLISVIEVDMSENPYLAPTEIQSFISGLSEEDRLSRVHGKFVQMGGLVFKKFDPKIHVIDPMLPPLDWAWYASLDHGFNNPTAWLWHAVSPDGVVVTFDEHYESERTVEYHAAMVHARDAEHGRVPDVYVGDPAIRQHTGVTADSVQTAYSNLDIPIVLGNNDVKIGISKMSQYLEVNTVKNKPNWFITRNCTNLIREMQRLRWKTYASKKMANDRNKQDEIHKKNDHAPDSARYFFTFLPDLRPTPTAPQARGPMPALPGQGLTGTTVPTVGRYDELLSQSLKNAEPKNTEWTYSSLDEYMGGEW